jgi:hypothetical protein
MLARIRSAFASCFGWLIGRGHWGNLTNRERQGYILWIPTAIGIATIEILGALGLASIPWTTISTTVGRLETRWHIFAVVVVVAITLVLYLGLAYTPPRVAENALVSETAFSLRAFIYDVCVVAGAIAAGLIAYHAGRPRLVRGYWIYGILLVFGVIVPCLYALIAKAEPTLFATIRSLGKRLPWFNLALAAGMAVLSFHLAIYPWPDIAHQSTKIAGVDSDHAKALAERQLSVPSGSFETVSRSTVGSQDAWVVTFYPPSGGGACAAAVLSRSDVRVLRPC